MIIFQMVTILGLAWLLRRPARAIGLPTVIGEMLTGFILGPTVFGVFNPQVFRAVFSEESLPQISGLATLIVASYCFVIGLEFDVTHLRGKRASLALTALASALLPAVSGYFAAGAIAAQMSAPVPASFNLAVSLVFSVTAFPVLLRIIEDAGVTGQPIAFFSIGISAILELLLWAGLPVILAIATAGNPVQAYTTLAWVAGFLVAWFTLVRTILQWFWKKLPVGGVASLLLLATLGIASVWVTDQLGMHAVFGAFVGGLVVPREVSDKLAKKIKPACVFLLPVFFAGAGLKTVLNLASSGEIIFLLAIALLAYAVKALGTALTARATGALGWNDAFTVGHLMCAKGAIGFAVLEICLSAGLLDANGYSVLAFVILANTIMAAWGVRVQLMLAGKPGVDESSSSAR